MPLVQNIYDPEQAATTTRIVNLGRLMDKVRAGDGFLPFPPPSKLRGMPEFIRVGMVEMWMMATPDNREHEWEQFFEANPEIFQVTSDVDDFLGKYGTQSQPTQTTQPGAFSITNDSDPNGGCNCRPFKVTTRTVLSLRKAV